MILEDQDLLGTPDQWGKVLTLIPEQSLRESLEKVMSQCSNSHQRWNTIQSEISKAINKVGLGVVLDQILDLFLDLFLICHEMYCWLCMVIMVFLSSDMYFMSFPLTEWLQEGHQAKLSHRDHSAAGVSTSRYSCNKRAQPSAQVPLLHPPQDRAGLCVLWPKEGWCFWPHGCP